MLLHRNLQDWKYWNHLVIYDWYTPSHEKSPLVKNCFDVMLNVVLGYFCEKLLTSRRWNFIKFAKNGIILGSHYILRLWMNDCSSGCNCNMLDTIPIDGDNYVDEWTLKNCKPFFVRRSIILSTYQLSIIPWPM